MGARASSVPYYVLKRTVFAVPIIVGVISLNFALVHIAPGSPVMFLAGEYGADPEYLEMMVRKYGLDKPIYEQYLVYLSKLIRGDLGYSLTKGAPVLDLIMSRFLNTLLLMGTAIFIFSLIGIILGIIASQRPYSLFDKIQTFFCLWGYSMPIFYLGQIVLLVFAVNLRLFPVTGMYSIGKGLSGVDSIIDLLRHMVLPVFCLGISQFAQIAQLTRTSMMESLKSDFIITARAKGLNERLVVYKHALRNALLPIVTMIGYRAGFILTGSALTEIVFSWPGMGSLLYDAIYWRDYPLIMGVFLFSSITVIAANIVTDIIYSLIDPRISYH